MIKYRKVLCDILKCTEYEEKDIKATTKMDGKVIMRDFEGGCHYDGKILEKNVPFIELGSPFHGVYVPESKFNTYTKLLINICINYLHKVTFDEKRFYSTSPFEVGDIFVEKIDNKQKTS